MVSCRGIAQKEREGGKPVGRATNIRRCRKSWESSWGSHIRVASNRNCCKCLRRRFGERRGSGSGAPVFRGEVDGWPRRHRPLSKAPGASSWVAAMFLPRVRGVLCEGRCPCGRGWEERATRTTRGCPSWQPCATPWTHGARPPNAPLLCVPHNATTFLLPMIPPPDDTSLLSLR